MITTVPRISRRLGRRTAAVGVLAAAALLLASCSGSGTDSASTSTDPAGAAASSTEPATGSTSEPSASGTSGSGSATTGATGGDTSAANGGQGAPSGSFSIGVNSFFLTHLMPGFSDGTNISNALFTPLTRYDAAKGELVDAVAKSIETTDQKNWTIVLNDGWTFHDGEPVTAQSFADSWNASADPKNAMTANSLMNIFAGYTAMNPAKGDKATATTLSGVKVVDEHTLKVTLASPNAFFPSLLASSGMAPIPPSAAKDFAAFDLNPIGNGPFKVAEGGMKAGDTQLVLEAYPGYAGEQKAKVESITVKAYQDTTAVYTDFQAGAIDLALVDGNDLASAKTEFPDQLVDVAYPAVVTLGFPTWDPRFDNPKLRQALSMAVDRQSIVDALLKGNGTAATGLAPESLPGGGLKDCAACTFDVEKAKSLLAEAGGFSGSITLYTYTDPTNQAVTDAIANMWRTNLGIDATTETQEIGQLYKNFSAQSLKGAFVVYAGTNIPHLYGLLNSLFTKGSALNTTGYSNEKLTTLLSDALAASSTEVFNQKVTEASGVAMADMRSVPLYHPTGALLHATKLSGVEPELLGGANLAAISVTG
jgi:peptide/nickel transport system substrate-binding protein/oligopeptide transport system substrate-binding protein